MCGVLGFVGKIKAKEKEEVQRLITALFNETESRGKHASGYASLVNSGNNISYSKLPIRASLFTDHDIYYNNMWDKKPTIFIGHCRYATSGKPQYNKNNHPFSANEGNLWMVHNGVCSGLKDNISKWELQSDCDSEYIIRVVEKDGWKDGIQKIVNSSADFALLFLDRSDDSIKFIHNEGRPLYLIDALNKYGIYILCSTLEIFKSACEVAEVKYKDFKKFSLRKNSLYEINLKDMKLFETKFKVEEEKKDYRSRSIYDNTYWDYYKKNDDWFDRKKKDENSSKYKKYKVVNGIVEFI